MQKYDQCTRERALSTCGKSSVHTSHGQLLKKKKVRTYSLLSVLYQEFNVSLQISFDIDCYICNRAMRYFFKGFIRTQMEFSVLLGPHRP